MTNPPAPIRPPTYSQELAQLILARGGEPDYAPGGRLPTERSLANEFGVTRTMVRHALAVLEAEGPGAWTPPATGRFTAGFAGLDVVPGRVLGRVAVDLPPDVFQVVAFAQGRHHRHYALRLHGPQRAELTMII